MAARHVRDLSRRELLKLFGLSLAPAIADPAARLRTVRSQQHKVFPRNTARNVVLIQNCGGMSSPDTFDFKETQFTPNNLRVERVHSDFFIPSTLFPHYAKWAHRASLVRSMYEDSLSHFAAQYRLQAGRTLNPTASREVPAIGTVIAMELESQRRASDTFPTFMSIDLWNLRCAQIGAGMMHPRFAGFDLKTPHLLTHSLDTEAALSPLSDDDIAYRVVQDSRFKKAFQLTQQEKDRYAADDPGITKIGLQLLVARNLLAADAGVRFLHVGNSFNGANGPFDNHKRLYGYGHGVDSAGGISIYSSARRLDLALAQFVADLSKLRGVAAGKTILDETMIVLANEFGRTPYMNAAGGRDHWGPCFTDVYIGGGVKPGRVIGKTDETCSKVVDTGWSFKEQITKNHHVATIYSALGIDYSKTAVGGSENRYDYQQTAVPAAGRHSPLTDIQELFV